VVSFTPRPLYPQEKSPWYPLDRRLGGPQSRSGSGGDGYDDTLVFLALTLKQSESLGLNLKKGSHKWTPLSLAKLNFLRLIYETKTVNTWYGAHDSPILHHLIKFEILPEAQVGL
jgi:hypothetical protein